MALSTSSANQLLLHLFNNTTIPNMGDATGPGGSTAAGSFYVALHTADPGVGGTQATSEAAYTGYARVAVARTAGGWTISTNTATNTAQVTFPACTGGSSVVTHASIGYLSSGAGVILDYGPLPSSLSISNGITPFVAAGAISATFT